MRTCSSVVRHDCWVAWVCVRHPICPVACVQVRRCTTVCVRLCGGWGMYPHCARALVSGGLRHPVYHPLHLLLHLGCHTVSALSFVSPSGCKYSPSTCRTVVLCLSARALVMPVHARQRIRSKFGVKEVCTGDFQGCSCSRGPTLPPPPPQYPHFVAVVLLCVAAGRVRLLLRRLVRVGRHCGGQWGGSFACVLRCRRLLDSSTILPIAHSCFIFSPDLPLYLGVFAADSCMFMYCGPCMICQGALPCLASPDTLSWLRLPP